jgi:hypothetical protein
VRTYPAAAEAAVTGPSVASAAAHAATAKAMRNLMDGLSDRYRSARPLRAAPLTPFNHDTERVGASFHKYCQAIVTQAGFL